MPTYQFKYLDGRIENIEGRNKKHAYSKMKKLYPDDIPYTIDRVGVNYRPECTSHSEQCLRFGIMFDCPICSKLSLR